jgi:hypothetical protein
MYSQSFVSISTKSEREWIGTERSLRRFSCCPFAFHYHARTHDEAIPSDYGGDTGDQYDLAAGADHYGE